MTSPAESASARRMLWVVAIVTVLPLLAAKHLPFTDLPEHVAVVSSLVHRADPSFHVQEHYVFAFPRSLLTQDQVFGDFAFGAARFDEIV